MKLIDEFREFLKEFKIIGLAIAFITGIVSQKLIESFVDDLLLPIIVALSGFEKWETATVSLFGVVFKWGSFLSALLNFLIVVFILFILSKKILKWNVAK